MPNFNHKNSESKDFRNMGIALSNEFSEIEGRRPRILVGSFPKNNTFSPNNLCNVLADMGFDVDIAPTLDSTAILLNQSIENDADILLICIDHNGLEDEFPKLYRQSLAVDFDMMLSLYLQDPANQSNLKSQFKEWYIYDSTNSELSIAFQLLSVLMQRNS